MIQKYTISRDDRYYECMPDVVLLPSGKLLCVFFQITHHARWAPPEHSRLMLTESLDRGRTWSPKRPLTEATDDKDYRYGVPRFALLRDGRLAVVTCRHYRSATKPKDSTVGGRKPLTDDGSDEKWGRSIADRAIIYFSNDEGETWSEPVFTPAEGTMVEMVELQSGRWLISLTATPGFDVQRLWYSDDQGKSWTGPVIVAQQEGLKLCEGSIVQIEGSTLVSFHRENSNEGKDCYKTISHDNGETWSAPIAFPLPGCHRPTARLLQDGHILITHRLQQGGKGWLGRVRQTTFASVTDVESALASTRQGAWARMCPIDYDRSIVSDTGYTGWVQFPDGEIYIVNYIVDDAPLAQIRGCSLRLEDIALPFPFPAGSPRSKWVPEEEGQETRLSQILNGDPGLLTEFHK